VRWGLRSKIFALMGSLVLGLLTATLLVVGVQADRSARQRLLADLHRTRQQFEALQQLRYQNLRALSRILSREYALRNAVATYDAPTILSAMQSFQARIQSDVFFVADDHGTVLAVTSGGAPLGEALSRHPALPEALQGEEALHIWQVQGTLYQVVTVPLTAGPDILGTLGIGYAIDQPLLHALHTITGSAITILTGHTILASTWPVATHPALANALADAGRTTAAPGLAPVPADIQALTVAGETYLSIAMPLVDPQQQPVGAYILQKSLDQELVPLHHLQRTVLGTGLVAPVLALVVSFLIARGVTAPVQALVQ
jgi:Double sensory domain of two-component sensor kinase